MKVLTTIASKGEGYTANVILDDYPQFPQNKNSVFFVGDADNDWDGSPRWHEDPYGQAETTLRFQGKSIDSWKVPGIVLPPECINVVSGIVMGCYAEISFRELTIPAVVFDIGPHFKLGELTPAASVRLKINPGHSSGGIDEQLITYRFWPGRPALVDGILYGLQPYRR